MLIGNPVRKIFDKARMKFLRVGKCGMPEFIRPTPARRGCLLWPDFQRLAGDVDGIGRDQLNSMFAR